MVLRTRRKDIYVNLKVNLRTVKLGLNNYVDFLRTTADKFYFVTNEEYATDIEKLIFVERVGVEMKITGKFPKIFVQKIFTRETFPTAILSVFSVYN